MHSIKIQVYSAEVPNLCVVDLPSLNRIPMVGMQENVEKINHSNVERYGMDEKTINLVVSEC